MTELFNAGKPWTNEQVDQLRDMFAKGATLEEIVEAMGRTPAGVISKMQNLDMIFGGAKGHYYPYPTEPWCQWQEVQAMQKKLRPW